jgi:cell fate (sporulation/competence/biofilm development) regulator YlbF (YheA/YmcA/DUF963 family)
MDNVIELTRQLGTALQADERYIRYSLAREKNEEDNVLQDLVGQFNILRMQLNEEIHKEPKDNDKIKDLNEKLGKKYEECMDNESMKEFSAAKADLDDLINQVNGLISMFVEGADPATCEPASCGGDCASCGGCH